MRNAGRFRIPEREFKSGLGIRQDLTFYNICHTADGMIEFILLGPGLPEVHEGEEVPVIPLWSVIGGQR